MDFLLFCSAEIYVQCNIFEWTPSVTEVSIFIILKFEIHRTFLAEEPVTVRLKRRDTRS